jgi:transcriptional regulator with XRE-family HTH domain
LAGARDTLGEIIRHQRELSELSVRKLAQMAGISNPYLSQIERGLRDPSEQVLDAIADALATSADALYEQAGLTRPEPEVPVDPRTLDKIAADPNLTPRQRRVLTDLYQTFTTEG